MQRGSVCHLVSMFLLHMQGLVVCAIANTHACALWLDDVAGTEEDLGYLKRFQKADGTSVLLEVSRTVPQFHYSAQLAHHVSSTIQSSRLSLGLGAVGHVIHSPESFPRSDWREEGEGKEVKDFTSQGLLQLRELWYWIGYSDVLDSCEGGGRWSRRWRGPRDQGSAWGHPS